MDYKNMQPQFMQLSTKELVEATLDYKAIAADIRLFWKDIRLYRGDFMLCFGALMYKLSAYCKHYGKDGMDRLAAELGVEPAWISDITRVAGTFKKAQLREIQHRICGGYMHISFQHLISISKMRSKLKRPEMLERAFTEGWSAEELSDAICAMEHPDIVSDTSE